jgi:small nuclear ribonucleoprotein G
VINLALYFNKLNCFLINNIGLVKINGNRLVTGTLRGYDPFMNLVIDEATEHVKGGNIMNPIGMVVVRGNSVVMIEALERLN